MIFSFFKEKQEKFIIINQNKNYELIKFEDSDFALDVNISQDEDAVLLTQKQMSKLFNVSVDNINLHIKNIIEDNELDNSVIEESSVIKFPR